MVRKKVLAIPVVAASEMGRAQTIRVYMNGVVGQWFRLSSGRVTKCSDSRTRWEARPQRVIVLYAKFLQLFCHCS